MNNKQILKINELPKSNPWESLQEEILFDWFEMMGIKEDRQETLMNGTAIITEIESRRFCAILKMTRSSFWKNLYENFNKPK